MRFDLGVIRRRPWLSTAVGAVIVLLVAGGVFFLLQDDEDEPDPLGARSDVPLSEEGGAEGNAAEGFGGGDPSLLYASFGATDDATLIRKNIIDQEEEVFEPFPAVAMSASQSSEWVAYVSADDPEAASDDEEGDDEEIDPSAPPAPSQPLLTVFDPYSEDETSLGVGLTPTWNATGDRVAFIRPLEPENCSAVLTCPGDVDVVVADPASGDETTVLEEGRWSIVAWAGDRLLLEEEGNAEETIVASLDGETEPADYTPAGVLGVSPDGSWLLHQADGEARFWPITDGLPSGDAVDVEIGDDFIYGATWSHDSAQVAATMGAPPGERPDPDRGKKGKKAKGGDDGKGDEEEFVPLTAEVRVFSPDDPEPAVVEETTSSFSAPLWSTSNDHIAVAKQVDDETNQTSYCPVALEGSCRLVFSFSYPAQMLRME